MYCLCIIYVNNNLNFYVNLITLYFLNIYLIMKISFLYSVFGIFICVSVACLVLAIISHDIFFLGISGLLALSAVLVGLEIKGTKHDPFNL